MLGDGVSNIVTDVVADAIHEIIRPSIDGLINPFDSDKSKSNDVGTPSTIINLLDNDMENDDPNHTSVFQVCQYHTIFLFIVVLHIETYTILMRYKNFQHLVKSGELKSWAEYNPQKLKTIISPPLSNAKKGIQYKYQHDQVKNPKTVESIKSSNEETLNLMETKTALAKLMMKNIEVKQRIEKY